MSENINDLCGTINGRPIAGYHVVLYGETQEYLESLVEKGVILMYSEDNPKEEGRLTVARPSTMPEWLKDYATNVVYDEYGNFISCSVEGLITLAENPTEEDIAEVNQNTYYYSPGSATGPAVLVNEEAKTADTTVNTEQEVTPATPQIHVTVTNSYDLDPSSPFYDRYEMIKNSGALILPMDGKVTVWPSNVIEYLNKNYPDWDTDSYTEEEIAALQDTYSHFLAGDYLLQGSDNTANQDIEPDLCGPGPKSIILINPVDATDDIVVTPADDDAKSILGLFGPGPKSITLITPVDATNDIVVSAADTTNSDPEVADPINIQDLVLSIDLTEEEIAAVLHSYSEIAQLDPSDIPSYLKIILKSTADTARDYGEGWSVIGRGDFNGNGTTDVLVTNPTAASDTVGLIGCWENDSEWQLIGGYSPEWDVLATADFNGDGKTDILWRNSFVGEDGNTYNAYCTWIMDESDNWRMVSASNADEWSFLCSGDFDGDGTADIAMINAAGLVSIWGVSDGRLSADAVLSAVDTSEWQFAGVGDFNGDGTTDIAWLNSETMDLGCWQVKNGQIASWSRESITPYLVAGEQLYMIQNASLA